MAYYSTNVPEVKREDEETSGGSDHVRWRCVEKILDSEPDVIFE